MSKKGKHYTDTFKKQIVELINIGKSYKEICFEYEIARSTVNKWVSNYNSSKSFKAKDNRTQSEIDLIESQKENKQLRMENDILKQAALILGRK
jgi:transposase